MSDSTTTVVRQFERVIDEGYRTLPILARPLDVALYGLLAVYDSYIVSQHMVSRANGSKPLSVGQVQLFKSRGEGLVWALRWLLESRQVPDARPVPREEVIAEAAKLVEYGSNYFLVGMMYSHFSKGQAHATVDVEAKHVRFDYTDEYRRSDCSWGFHDNVSNETLQKAARDQRVLVSLKSAAERAIHQVDSHLENGRIVLDVPQQVSHPDVQAWSDAMCKDQHIFPAAHEMGGFTMREFNQFWQTLIAWSVCVSEQYLSAWSRGIVPQEQSMPTQVVPRPQFIDGIKDLSGLNRDAVERITARMTFDWRTEKPDVFLQPLLCGETAVAWSPALIQMCRFQRNLLKLMARTPAEKPLADDIIGEREQQLLGQLQTILERKGWSVALNRGLHCDGEAEVDLLAVNWRHPEEVLVVEAKAFLQVDDVNEIRSATIEMQRAQDQVRRVVRMLKAMPLDERRRLFPFVEWDKVTRWFGVIVTPETEPSINFDHTQIPATSLLTLQSRLRPKDWAGPCRIWQAMVQRQWQAFLRDAEFSSEEIELAGITYELPLIAIRD